MSKDTSVWPLVCPACAGPLVRFERVLRCGNGHSHDIAREGYINLLLPQHAERGIEGDTPEMLRARQRFLDDGHYAPLVDRLRSEVKIALEGVNGRRCVAEAGCGVGYYIGSLARGMSDASTQLVGMDISKAAVRMAAKRYREGLFVVANTRRRLYVESGSVNVLLDVFAPRNPDEFARVVAPGGTLLVVIPGPDHLAGVRDRLGLLGIQEAKEERVVDQLEGRFALAGRSVLDYTVHPPASSVQDLVAMGPSSRHSPRWPDETSDVRLSFILLRFTRTNPT